MKATFLLENLLGELSFLNRAVSTRAQLPILFNLHLLAEKGRLTFSATDLEIGVQTQIPANIEKNGETTIPAKTFSELMANLSPSEKITFEQKDKNLEVLTKNTKTTFQTIDAAEFPKLYEEEGEKKAALKKETIENSFPKIVFAASLDLDRPALSGVLIKEEKDGLLMVATDAHRLSLKKKVLAKINKLNGHLLVSARTLKELLLMKGGEDILVFVSGKNNQIIFSQGDSILVGRLIDAEYPNYEKIIPVDFATRGVFEKEELEKAVKISSIFAREEAGTIKVSLKKDKIVVSAANNSVDVPAKVEGEENEIAFNARYVLEFLGNIEEGEIVFEMTGPLNPGVFKISKDPNFLHLIMPIRL